MKREIYTLTLSVLCSLYCFSVKAQNTKSLTEGNSPNILFTKKIKFDDIKNSSRKIPTDTNQNNEEKGSTITNSAFNKKKKDDGNKGENNGESGFTFLNAADFDINGLGKSNYLAHVNIFYTPKKKFHWGFNSGIMKISYNSDSSSNILAFRDITINPRKEITVGSKFYRQSSYVSTIITNTAYSLYVQPTFLLYTDDESKEDANKIYVHGHFELLIFNNTAKSSYAHTLQDTLTYTQKDSAQRRMIYRGDPSDTSARTSKQSVLNGYFGVGVTFDLHPWSNGSFFFQPTIGRTTDFPSLGFYLGKNNSKLENWNTFYLIRTMYTQKLSNENNTKVVIGTDIRGIFPTYRPLYSIYVGVSLDINAFFGFIFPKKGG